MIRLLEREGSSEKVNNEEVNESGHERKGRKDEVYLPFDCKFSLITFVTKVMPTLLICIDPKLLIGQV